MWSITLLISSYLGSVLIVSGLAKVNNLEGFKSQLLRQRLIPRRVCKQAAVLIPCLELSIAFLLTSGIATTYSVVISIGLFSVLSASEAALIVLKRSRECGCYGTILRRPVDLASLTATGLMAALSVVELVLVETWPVSRLAYAIVGSILWALAMTMAWRVTQRVRAKSRTLEAPVGTAVIAQPPS